MDTTWHLNNSWSDYLTSKSPLLRYFCYLNVKYSDPTVLSFAQSLKNNTTLDNKWRQWNSTLDIQRFCAGPKALLLIALYSGDPTNEHLNIGTIGLTNYGKFVIQTMTWTMNHLLIKLFSTIQILNSFRYSEPHCILFEKCSTNELLIFHQIQSRSELRTFNERNHLNNR